MAQGVPEPAARELAPNGKLRAAINYGNLVLAQKGADGEPRGVSAELARELARRLGTPITFVEFPSAGATFDALAQDSWDVAFLAVDPKRAERIAFSAPYVRIEGAFLVRADSAFAANEDVDRQGVRIAVGKGSAYALYLQRALKSAKLVEAPTSAGAVDLFVSQRLDVAAGVRQPIEAYAKAHVDVRVLPGRFMVIDQAVATPIARLAAARYLHSFVEEMKASGFVARALAASGQMDAAVAPLDPVK
jgi:polar amino acid transport system substrate-binding protein